MRFPWLLAACAVLLIGAPLQARDKSSLAASTQTIPAHGVIGIEEQHLTPEFWVDRLATPDKVVMDRAAIAAVVRMADKIARWWSPASAG